MTYSTLLLDADETLLDFAAAEKKALFLTMQELGYAISEQEHKLYSEINDAQWKKLERGETTKPILTVARFSLFLSELGIVADAKGVNQQYTENLSLGSDLIDGAMDFLETVKKHFSRLQYPIILGHSLDFPNTKNTSAFRNDCLYSF
jgi:2-haloacid dehalogenase